MKSCDQIAKGIEGGGGDDPHWEGKSAISPKKKDLEKKKLEGFLGEIQGASSQA